MSYDVIFFILIAQPLHKPLKVALPLTIKSILDEEAQPANALWSTSYTRSHRSGENT